ncbi:SUM1 [Symbiodinium sp. CCMP2592]|nr:SUM1 [Symbiodinium sp. CCMP2592]
MAKAGAKYINKGGASGISDLAGRKPVADFLLCASAYGPGHTQENGEELGGLSLSCHRWVQPQLILVHNRKSQVLRASHAPIHPGPYFPRIFPERVPEEEAGQLGSMTRAYPGTTSVRQKQQRMQQVLLRNCFVVLPTWLKPVLFPSPLQGQGLLSFAMHGYADRQAVARRTAILAESAVRSANQVHGTTPVFRKDDRIKRLLRDALDAAADPLSSYLEDLDNDHFEQLIDAFRPHEVPMDAYVIVQGHYVENDKPGLFVLEDGMLEALRADKYEEKVVRRYTEPGSIFGELAVLHQAPRAATVVARTDAVIWSVSRQTVRKITCSFQEAKRRYYDRKLMSVDVLQPLDDEERQQVIECLRTRHYDPGYVIIREGEEGHEFFLLIEGTATVSKNGRELKTYKPGDYFGELALMHASPRAATVTATDFCTLAVLAEKDFRRLLGPLASFHEEEGRRPSRLSRTSSPRQSFDVAGRPSRLSQAASSPRQSLDGPGRASRLSQAASSPRQSFDGPGRPSRLSHASSPIPSVDVAGEPRRVSHSRSTIAGCRESCVEHPAQRNSYPAARPSRMSCR